MLEEKASAVGEITDCQIRKFPDGRSRGIAFVGFKDIETAEKAVKFFDGTYLDTCKISVEFARPIGDPILDETYSRREKIKKAEQQEQKVKHKSKPAKIEDDPDYQAYKAAAMSGIRASWNDAPVIAASDTSEDESNQEEQENPKPTPDAKHTNRLYITNVPYETTDTDLEQFFSKFGEVTDVLIPFDVVAQRPRGYAFVTFANEESVDEALKESVIFEGRHLRLQRGEAAPEHEEKAAEFPDDDESFRDKKKRLMKVENPKSWNALFLSKDTIVKATAAMLGFTPAQMLNPESDDLATRVTLAEAQLVKETKKMFEKAGIDLAAFDDIEHARLSKTLIIAKNFKYEVNEENVRAMFASYGSLVRFIFPPTHACALVEFARSDDARKAFRALNFKMVLDQPMLLQWAPAAATGAGEVRDDEEQDTGYAPRHRKSETEKKLKTTTLVMKNVPFKATKKELYDIVNTYARVKSIRMTKKADGSGHRGFAFLDFNTKQEAAAALENLGNVHLYDRHLIVQPAEKGRNVESLAKSNDE